MFKGKTKSGFHYQIPEDVYDDIELVESLAQMYAGDLTAVPTVIEMVLGKEQKKQLYDHLRDDRGRTKATLVMNEMEEMLAALNNNGKNS